MGKGWEGKDRERGWEGKRDGREGNGEGKRREAQENCHKQQFSPNFQLWVLLYPPLSPIWVKFGMYVQAHVYCSMQNLFMIGLYYYI